MNELQGTLAQYHVQSTLGEAQPILRNGTTDSRWIRKSRSGKVFEGAGQIGGVPDLGIQSVAMSQRKEITELVLNQFSELVTRWGFQAPKVTEEARMTRIDYFKGDLGFEVELDWREFELIALLVRLENGHLPDGYYVSNGRQCRKHLNNVIREQRWSLMQPQAQSKRTSTAATMKQAAEQAKRTLIAHLDRIIPAGDTLFS